MFCYTFLKCCGLVLTHNEIMLYLLYSGVLPVILTTSAPPSSICPTTGADEKHDFILILLPTIQVHHFWGSTFSLTSYWEKNSLSRTLRSSATAIIRRAAWPISFIAAAAWTSASVVSIIVVISRGSARRTSFLWFHLIWCCEEIVIRKGISTIQRQKLCSLI